MKTLWLIERTDVAPPLYLANIYGGLAWVPDPHGAIHHDTEHAARKEWANALEEDPWLEARAAHVEIREHQFG